MLYHSPVGILSFFKLPFITSLTWHPILFFSLFPEIWSLLSNFHYIFALLQSLLNTSASTQLTRLRAFCSSCTDAVSSCTFLKMTNYFLNILLDPRVPCFEMCTLPPNSSQYCFFSCCTVLFPPNGPLQFTFSSLLLLEQGKTHSNSRFQ